MPTLAPGVRIERDLRDNPDSWLYGLSYRDILFEMRVFEHDGLYAGIIFNWGYPPSLLPLKDTPGAVPAEGRYFSWYFTSEDELMTTATTRIADGIDKFLAAEAAGELDYRFPGEWQPQRRAPSADRTTQDKAT